MPIAALFADARAGNAKRLGIHETKSDRATMRSLRSMRSRDFLLNFDGLAEKTKGTPLTECLCYFCLIFVEKRTIED